MVVKLTVYVDDVNSNVYLSFEFSKEIGVNATFKDDGNVDITNMLQDTGPQSMSMFGNWRNNKELLTILREHHLKILNQLNSIGVTVNLGGSGRKAKADVYWI